MRVPDALLDALIALILLGSIGLIALGVGLQVRCADVKSIEIGGMLMAGCK